VISPYAKQGFIDHQTLSFDAYLKFIEDRAGYEAYAIDKELRGHWTTGFDNYCEQVSGRV